MQKLVPIWTISLCMLLFGSAVHAFTPLVEAEWVKGQIGKKGIVMLDLRTLSSYQKGACTWFDFHQLQQRWMAYKKLRREYRDASPCRADLQSHRRPWDR